MPTVQQDLTALRAAVYGKDVRENIARAIEDINDTSNTRISGLDTRVNQRVLYITASKISGTNDKYKVVVTNATQVH